MGRTVLVIDSSDFVHGVVGRALMENGCRVVAASKMKQAWLALETDTPHLIVLEIPAQPSEVVKFLGLLRTLPDCQHVPVILLADQAQLQLANKLNASEVILRDENLEVALIEAAKKLFTINEQVEESPRSMLF